MEQKWALIDTCSKAAFNSTITNKDDREYLFLKYCLPTPIPNKFSSLLTRGETLYDKMSPFVVPNDSLAKAFSPILTSTQNCYSSPMMNAWPNDEITVWMDSQDEKDKTFYTKIHSVLESMAA